MTSIGNGEMRNGPWSFVKEVGGLLEIVMFIFWCVYIEREREADLSWDLSDVKCKAKNMEIM